MSAMDRIVEAAYRLVTAADEDECLHALTELRDEIAEEPGAAYINQLIGGYQP